MLRESAMWMSSPFTHQTSFFFLLHDSCRPKRDCLLFVARHTAVTLTRNAPLSRAQGPGISVSSVERSGVFVSRFWLSSRRSLGRCLLLGQRSRMNFFSHLIGSLFHQHYRNPHTQLTCHRHNGDSGSDLARVFSANHTEKISELILLSDGRPRRLDEFTSQPSISSAGDRSAIGSLAGRVFAGHQTQKAGQLANVLKLSPVADASQKLARHDPAHPRNRHQIFHTLGQFRIVLQKPPDLSCRLKDLLLVKFQAVEQLIQFKACRSRTRKLTQLTLHYKRPLTAGRCLRKLNPFHEQQRFNPLLHPYHLAHQHIAQLSEMTKLTING